MNTKKEKTFFNDNIVVSMLGELTSFSTRKLSLKLFTFTHCLLHEHSMYFTSTVLANF